MRGEQRICQRHAEFREDGIERSILEDFADERIAVGVRTRGADADAAYRRGADRRGAGCRSRSTTPTIVPARSNSPGEVDARHLGRLAADQGAARLAAGLAAPVTTSAVISGRRSEVAK